MPCGMARSAIGSLSQRLTGSSMPATPIPSDLDIARSAAIRPIEEVAGAYGLTPDDLIPFGHTKAKVHLDALPRIAHRPKGRYIDVTAITPTPLGEGKTTTTVGLVQGLGRLFA